MKWLIPLFRDVVNLIEIRFLYNLLFKSPLMKIKLFVTLFAFIGFQMCLARNKTVYKSWDLAKDSTNGIRRQA